MGGEIFHHIINQRANLLREMGPAGKDSVDIDRIDQIGIEHGNEPTSLQVIVDQERRHEAQAIHTAGRPALKDG